MRHICWCCSAERQALQSNKQNISVPGREGNVFPPEFQKAGFETEIRGVRNGKENAPPLQFHWMKGAAALSHSALTDSGGNRARY